MSRDDPRDGAADDRDLFAEPPGSGAPGEHSPQRYPRADLRRKVSLKFKEFQGFVNEYSENVSAGGMFIRTSSPQPVGTVFDFEFTLGDDYTLIHGLGEVVWVRERDAGFDRPPGMGVRFLSLDPGSRKLIDRMVAERLARGGDEGGFDEPKPFAVGLGAGAASEDAAWWGDEGTGPARTVAVGADEYREAERSPFGPDDSSTAVPPTAAAEDRGPSVFEEPARPRGGPSPYIYSRTYHGAGYSKGGGGGRGRPLLVVLLIVVSLVAGLAAFVLLAPETAQSWLMGGDDDGERLVARQPEGDERIAGDPVEPVAPEDAAPLAPPPTAPSDEDSATDETGDEEVGFFSPAEEPEPPSETDPEPAPAPPPPAPAEEPPPTEEPSGPVSRVLNVIWEERGEETLVTVHLDGAIEEWGYSTVRLDNPPRELVRIDGIERPFPRPTIPVGTDLVEQVRLGFHPEGRTSQMHVVVDLADPGARLDRSEAAGSEIRLWFARGGG